MSDSHTSNDTVDKFFDRLTDDYAEAIERCFPRYREMFWALLDYLPADLEVKEVLELGTGTGNLSVLLAEKYPTAKIHLVDISDESLAVCRSRLGTGARVQYQTEDFRKLRFETGRFDLVASSIAVHHLDASEKQTLFSQIFDWLRPGGMFAYADQHAGATEDLCRRHLQNWKAAAMAAGSTQAEWEMWMKHQADHDHHDTLVDQIDWLRSAGFKSVDCPWRYLLWTVLQASKPSAN